MKGFVANLKENAFADAFFFTLGAVVAFALTQLI